MVVSDARTGPARRRARVESRETVITLDLDDIRSDLADKWEKLAPAIYRFARLVIDRHVGAHGTFEQQGDKFLIQLTGVSRFAASRMRRDLHRDLHELLFGSGAFEDLPLRGGKSKKAGKKKPRAGFWDKWMTGLRRAFLFETTGENSARALSRSDAGDASAADHGDAGERQAGEPAGATDPVKNADHRSAVEEVPAHDPDREEPTGAVSPARGRLDSSDEQAERLARESSALSNGRDRPLGGLQGSDTRGPDAKQRRGGGDGAARDGSTSGNGKRAAAAAVPSKEGQQVAKDLEGRSSNGKIRSRAVHEMGRSSRSLERMRRESTAALERALANAALEAEKTGDIRRPGLGFPPRGMKFLYRPMWYIPKGMLTTFTCLPVCSMGPFEFVTGPALLPKNPDVAQISMLDHLVIRDVLAQLTPRTARQVRSLVCLPVHYDTLMGPHGSDYFGLLDELPETVRDKIVFEIVGITRGLGQVQTQTLVRRLRARGRAVIGRVESSDNYFSLWRQCELSSVGFDLENDDRPENVLIAEMDRFALAASQHAMEIYVRGVKSSSLAIGAIMSGFDYIEGPAISEGDLTLLTRPVKYGLAEIYEGMECEVTQASG